MVWDLLLVISLDFAKPRGDQWHQILPMFQRLRHWRLRATVVTYGSLLSGYETNSQWQEAGSSLGIVIGRMGQNMPKWDSLKDGNIVRRVKTLNCVAC